MEHTAYKLLINKEMFSSVLEGISFSIDLHLYGATVGEGLPFGNLENAVTERLNDLIGCETFDMRTGEVNKIKYMQYKDIKQLCLKAFTEYVREVLEETTNSEKDLTIRINLLTNLYSLTTDEALESFFALGNTDTELTPENVIDYYHNYMQAHNTLIETFCEHIYKDSDIASIADIIDLDDIKDIDDIGEILGVIDAIDIEDIIGDDDEEGDDVEEYVFLMLLGVLDYMYAVDIITALENNSMSYDILKEVLEGLL